MTGDPLSPMFDSTDKLVPQNLYQVLQLDRSATGEEIRKRLENAREQSQIRSRIPRYREEAAARLKQLNQIEQVLLDAERRNQYDRDIFPDSGSLVASTAEARNKAAAEVVPINQQAENGQKARGIVAPTHYEPQSPSPALDPGLKSSRRSSRIVQITLLLLVGMVVLVGIFGRGLWKGPETRLKPAPIIDGRQDGSVGNHPPSGDGSSPMQPGGGGGSHAPDAVTNAPSTATEKPSPTAPKVKPTRHVGIGRVQPDEPPAPSAIVKSGSEKSTDTPEAWDVVSPPVQISPPVPTPPISPTNQEVPTLNGPGAADSSPAVYLGPHSGTLVWEGEITGVELITIEPGGPNSGRVTGKLPGVSVYLQPADPKRVSVVSPPAPSNGFQKVILRVQGKGYTTVRLTWTVP